MLNKNIIIMSKTSIIYKEILLYEEIGEHRKFTRQYDM